MSRRALVYTVLALTSVVVSACSQPTAPRRDDTVVCDGIVTVLPSGLTCDDK